MFIDNYYNKVIFPMAINKTNIYNEFHIKKFSSINLVIQLNTFKNEKNLKIIKLFSLLFFLSKQRPFLKKVKFTYIKKQIMKSFFFLVTLRKKNLSNFLLYLINYYIYFFNIYYLKSLKYNVNGCDFLYYIDNIHNQYKNYGKLSIKSQVKVIFSSKIKFNSFMKLLNNYYILNLK